MKFRSADKVEVWFDEHVCPELSDVTDPDPVPTIRDIPPEQVSFSFEHIDQGNYRAGTTEIIERFRFTARGVTEWSCPDPEVFFSDTGSWEFNVTDVDIGELDSPIRLIFDQQLVLECRELNVESLGKLSRMVRPRISETVVKINMYGLKQIPRASDWCEWFEREGLSICFRRLGA